MTWGAVRVSPRTNWVRPVVWTAATMSISGLGIELLLRNSVGSAIGETGLAYAVFAIAARIFSGIATLAGAAAGIVGWRRVGAPTRIAALVPLSVYAASLACC